VNYFSKRSPVDIFCSKLNSEPTFENFFANFAADGGGRLGVGGVSCELFLKTQPCRYFLQ